MTVKLQILIAVIVVFSLIYLIRMVRANRLMLRYALSWLVVGVMVLIMDLFPSIMDRIARLIGIKCTMNMLFFFGFLFTLGLIFVLTVAISRNTIRMTELAQEMALRDKENRELREMIGDGHRP